MICAEFDGVACFMVRARIEIPAARFTLRFHKETSAPSRYLTKSQCSHRENYRITYRVPRQDMSAHLNGRNDLKFRGYVVKRKISGSLSARSYPRIKIVRKMPIDFLLPSIPPRTLSATIVRLVGTEKQVKKKTTLEVSFAWADPNTVSLLNSETTDLDVTVTELYTDYATVSRQFLRDDNKLLLASRTFDAPRNSS